MKVLQNFNFKNIQLNVGMYNSMHYIILSFSVGAIRQDVVDKHEQSVKGIYLTYKPDSLFNGISLLYYNWTVNIPIQTVIRNCSKLYNIMILYGLSSVYTL